MALNTDVRVWDPTKVLLIVGFKALGDFAQGTFIRLTPEQPLYRRIRRIDGPDERARHVSRGRVLSVTLAPGAPDNDYLSGLRIADSLAPGGVTVPWLLKDKNGRSIHGDFVAWIDTEPVDEYASTLQPRVWNIYCPDSKSFHGAVGVA